MLGNEEKISNSLVREGSSYEALLEQKRLHTLAKFFRKNGFWVVRVESTQTRI